MLWQLSGQEEGSGPGRGVGRLPFASGSRVVLVLGGYTDHRTCCLSAHFNLVNIKHFSALQTCWGWDAPRPSAVGLAEGTVGQAPRPIFTCRAALAQLWPLGCPVAAH